MRFRTFVTKIDTEISIVTLGSICLLIASFIQTYDTSFDVSPFTVSGFCLIISGAILIYRETVGKRDILPTIEKKDKGENMGHADYINIGQLGVLNIIANTLFDIGIFFLVLGALNLLLSELIRSSFIKNPFFIALIIILSIQNFFNRRFFAK